MARARKKEEAETEQAENADPRLGDDIRRFVSHAADMIDGQEKAAAELAAIREALEKTTKTHERVSKAIAIREREGITVRLEGDIDDAGRRIRTAIAEPVERAERIARETRMTAALSGLVGGVIGGTLIAVLSLFNLI